MKLTNRLNKYFEPHLQNFVFDELASSALARYGALETLGSVPVPLNADDLKQIAEGEGITTARLAVNMAYVLGCVPDFRYAEDYLKFMEEQFRGEMYGGVVRAGEVEADAGRLENACIYFRAAILLAENDLKAMFGYAMACRELYISASSEKIDEDGNTRFEGMNEAEIEEYSGRFKAETMESLEQITISYPGFAEPYYYLGYAYLNMGLYIKADLTFKAFLENSTDAEMKNEIRERREQLEGPVEIEKGINDVLAGRFEEGMNTLERYIDTPATDKWWPIYYYLGLSYSRCGYVQEAINTLKRGLIINPNQIDSMQELADIYEALGDSVNSEKYLNKIELYRSYAAEEAGN